LADLIVSLAGRRSTPKGASPSGINFVDFERCGHDAGPLLVIPGGERYGKVVVPIKRLILQRL